jgi:DNA-binding NtrC family response regulator
VDLAHELETAQARHLDVAEHEVDGLGGEQPERLGGVARGRDLVADAAQDPLEGPPIELLVVDDENVGQGRSLPSDEGGRPSLGGGFAAFKRGAFAAFKRPRSGTDRRAMTTPAAASADAEARPEDLPGLVLLVDDEALLLRSLRRIQEADGHRLILADGAEAAARALAVPDLDVVLLDLFLGEESGMELLERVKRERPEVEVVAMTGHASIESAVRCIQRGAFDYLAKPFEDVFRVRTTVRKALDRRRLVSRNRQLELELRDRGGVPELVGRSEAMRALGRTLHALRHNESHVLVQGESGTGKELVARALWGQSPRAAGAFVPVDCAALPESIIESELFGHERGAFTGAVGATGLFRMANHGTLFLDEVGELPLAVQAKLLRALQHKEIRPVGSASAVPVDIRVISATHRNLAEMVAEGRFRADLFYRLNVVRIEIPPLRERREDVPLLAHHFLRKHAGGSSRVAGIEEAALEALVAAEWPGNVRELENAIESALALAPGPKLRLADFPALRRRAAATAPAAPPADLPLSLAAYERCALERALRETGGDATRAARLLGIGRSTLYRRLAQHGLSPRGGAGATAPIR